MIANSILLATTGIDTASIQVLHSPLPANVYVEDDFSTVLVTALPFFLLVMFIPPVYNMVFLIVKEKESKTRESMRMVRFLLGSQHCDNYISLVYAAFQCNQL
jgi:hypothetical protein